jgi:hypothetical protein
MYSKNETIQCIVLDIRPVGLDLSKILSPTEAVPCTEALLFCVPQPHAEKIASPPKKKLTRNTYIYIYTPKFIISPIKICADWVIGGTAWPVKNVYYLWIILTISWLAPGPSSRSSQLGNEGETRNDDSRIS